MKYIETVLVLFVLASAVIVPTDFVLAAHGREPFAPRPQGTSAVDQDIAEPPQRIIKDGLLWWLARGGTHGLEACLADVGGWLNEASSYFHSGPSRGGAR